MSIRSWNIPHLYLLLVFVENVLRFSKKSMLAYGNENRKWTWPNPQPPFPIFGMVILKYTLNILNINTFLLISCTINVWPFLSRGPWGHVTIWGHVTWKLELGMMSREFERKTNKSKQRKPGPERRVRIYSKSFLN